MSLVINFRFDVKLRNGAAKYVLILNNNCCACRYNSGPPRFGGSRNGPPPGKKFGNPGDRLRKKHWNLDELPKFEKNFYQEHHEVSRRTPVSIFNTCGGFLSCIWGRIKVFCFSYFSKKLTTTEEAKKLQWREENVPNPLWSSMKQVSQVSWCDVGLQNGEYLLLHLNWLIILIYLNRLRDGCDP